MLQARDPDRTRIRRSVMLLLPPKSLLVFPLPLLSPILATLFVLMYALTGAVAQEVAAMPAPATADSITVMRQSTAQALKTTTELTEGAFVETLGFYAPGDGGGALYIIRQTSEELEPNDGDILTLANGLVAVLQEREAVNYRMFGAVGDGENDDGVQMKLAHEYANSHRIPVINLSGEFWIKETTAIPIMTSVRWGQTQFHIDEKYNLPSAPRFLVLNDRPTVPIELTDELKTVLLEKIRPGVQVIPELAQYAGHLITVIDDQDRIGIRAGYEGNRGWAREELFYVEEEGRIIGDIAFTFEDFTSASATPCSDVYTVIEGGGFYVSGESPNTGSPGYHSNGFSIRRSRTIIREQWVGLEPGAHDVCLAARSGFYSLSRVFDVTLENIRLMPWIYRRQPPEQSVQHGTYGIGGSRMLNCVFRNITAEAGPMSWGVFGTNINKNFRIERCRLNRVDVHFHCWNLYIQDSEIGFAGISVTGGGDLFIDNSTRYGNNFVAFRRDYGSRWDGRVRLRGCTLKPNGTGGVSVLAYNPMDFDYKYPIGMGHSVTIDDLLVDFSAVPDSTAPCWLMSIPSFSATQDGGRLFFPEYIRFSDIRVRGREQGVRLVRIPDPYHYDLGRSGFYDGNRLEPNCTIDVANVQLEQLTAEEPKDLENLHLRIGDQETGQYTDGLALYPRLRVRDCRGISAYLGNSIADVAFERCSVNLVNAPGLQGTLTFTDCAFEPRLQREVERDIYALDAAMGTRLTNCTIHAPIVGGQTRPELVDRSGFLQINGPVRHYHLNTTLGGEILTHLRETGTALDRDFVTKLQIHHALAE